MLRYAPQLFIKLFSQATSQNRPQSNRLAENLLYLAQHKAQRQAFRQRQLVMQMDDWLTDALSFARHEID